MRQRKWKRVVTSGVSYIDGSTGVVSWFITITGSTTLQVRNLIAGRIYVFLLEQSGVHQVQFSGIDNAQAIAPIATSRSLQAFMALSGTNMKAIAPGGWQL